MVESSGATDQGNAIQIALGVRRGQVQCGWGETVAHRQGRNGQLHAAGGIPQVLKMLLNAGLLHGEQELKSDDTVVNDTRSQQQLIALKTNLSELTKVNHPLYFAIIAGVEKFGEEMLAFNSSTSDEGQFLNYGRQPLFLNVGGGTQFLNGINVGASVHISLRAEATLNASSNLAGETQYEELDVTAKPVLRPVLSTSQEWGKIICGHNDDCRAQFRTRSRFVVIKLSSNLWSISPIIASGNKSE